MSTAIIPAFSISDNPAEISASLDEAGCAVVHGMFSEEQCAQMRAELDSHLEHAAEAAFAIVIRPKRLRACIGG